MGTEPRRQLDVIARRLHDLADGFDRAIADKVRARPGFEYLRGSASLDVAQNFIEEARQQKAQELAPIRLNPHYPDEVKARVREEVRGLPDEELQARAAATHEAYGEARRLGDRQWMETYGGGLQLARAELQQRGIEDPTRQREPGRGYGLGD